MVMLHSQIKDIPALESHLPKLHLNYSFDDCKFSSNFAQIYVIRQKRKSHKTKQNYTKHGGTCTTCFFHWPTADLPFPSPG